MTGSSSTGSVAWKPSVAFSRAAQASYQNVLDVQVDTTSTDTIPRDNLSTTFSHTTGTGADRLMLVSVTFGWDQGQSVSSITYNGDNLSLVGSRSYGGGTNPH